MQCCKAIESSHHLTEGLPALCLGLLDKLLQQVRHRQAATGRGTEGGEGGEGEEREGGGRRGRGGGRGREVRGRKGVREKYLIIACNQAHSYWGQAHFLLDMLMGR